MSGYMRVEIIVDRPLLEEVKRIARVAGLSGHTVMPALGGEGAGGAWSEDLVTGAQSKLVYLAVTSKAKAQAFISALEPLLETHGLVALYSAVSVVRGAKFD